jgi:ABC-2 type transport system permease protein
LHSFGEDGRLVRDSGLAYHFIFGLFIAGYAACSSLAREMRSGTVSAVLSKPVGREVFFMSKFAGIAAVICAFSMCAAISTLLSERAAEKFIEARMTYVTDVQTGRMLIAAPFVAFLIAGIINYLTRRPFESTAFGLLLVALLAVVFIAGFFDIFGHIAPFDPRVQWRIVPASLLVTMALVVLSAIALGLSVRLGTVPTLTLLFVVLIAGLVSDYALGRLVSTSNTALVMYRLIPNWQHFWVPEALANGGTIPLTYLANAGIYGAAYSAGVLCLGVIAFRHTEMK